MSHSHDLQPTLPHPGDLRPGDLPTPAHAETYLPAADGGLRRAVPSVPALVRAPRPGSALRTHRDRAFAEDHSARTAVVSTEIVDSSSDLRAIRLEWTKLVEASGCDRVFLSWEWLASWWSVLGEGRLAVVCMRRGGELIGLAPLRRTPALEMAGGAWALAATPTLRFLGTGLVGTDHLDVPALPGEEAAVAEALARFVEREGAILELEQLSENQEGVASRLAVILERRSWQTTVRATHVCPYARLAGETWDSFVSGLGSSHRQNLRRRLRKIEEKYEVSLDTARSGPELEEALDVLFHLHALRWGPRGGSDAFSHPDIRRFHRVFLREAAVRGWPRLFVLRLDGIAVAALYGLFDGERFLFYQSGFDPEYSADSVGLVLMGMTLRAAIDEGALEYDFLHGEERYKRHWAGSSRNLLRRELFPPTIHGLVRHGLRRLEQGARGRLRHLRSLRSELGEGGA